MENYSIDWVNWFAFSRELAEQNTLELKCADIVIYCFLHADEYFQIQHRKQKQYRPSLATIAKCTANSQKIVRASLKRLTEAGLITELAPATSREGKWYQVNDYRDVANTLNGTSNREEREAYLAELNAQKAANEQSEAENPATDELSQSVISHSEPQPPEAPQDVETVLDDLPQPEAEITPPDASEIVTEHTPEVTDDDLKAYIEHKGLPVCDSMVSMFRQALTKSKSEADSIYNYLRNRN